MGPSTAKGRIVVGGIVKKIRQQGMRLLFQQVEVVLLDHLINTSTPNKHWSVSASCLMKGKRRGMLLASFQLYQPNKVKAYQTTNTYNKLIEPDNATSAASSMTNLLKLLSSKNIKQKLGKGAASSQGSKTPFPSLFLIQIVIVIKLHQEPLKRLIQWKVIKNHQ